MVFVIHESVTGIYMSPPSWTSFLPPFLSYPSGLSQSTSLGFGCLASCIKLALVNYFTYGSIYVSMLFSQIIPPLPFPPESKSLFFISVSFYWPDCQYRLSKFHMYALIWGFPGGSAVKNLPSIQETQVQSLGQEDPLEKEMATHFSTHD